MLKYSVLMSVYHKEKPKWLFESINSMLSQTVSFTEFVLVKDGPLTKELDRIINDFSKQYPELFRIIVLKKNVGLGPALNIGIKACSNELIARMDSDDISMPERCERQLKIFENNPFVGMVGCFEAEFENSPTKVKFIHKVPENNDEIYTYMHRRCAVLHPTVIYKKSAVLSCGGYQDAPLYEDYDLFIRMIINGVICYNVQEPLYYMRINSNFYNRRGGIFYLKKIISFKRRQYTSGFYSLVDYLISAGVQTIVCLMPNKVREYVYKKFLRN